MNADAVAVGEPSPGAGRDVPLRVLHLTHDMSFGGTEQVVRHLVEGGGDGLESEVACIDGRIGPIGEALRRAGTPVHALTRRAGFDVSLLRTLRRLLAERRVDLVHCHQYTPWCYGAPAAAGRGVPVLFTEHGRFHPDRHTTKRRLANQVLRRLTDRITTISEATRDALARHEWLPRAEVEVLYNGLPSPVAQEPSEALRVRLGIAPGTVLLGTVARLDPIKNQAMMLRALARPELRRCALLLAGDGPERAALEAQATLLGVAGRVRFVGFTEDVGGHLEALDVFLLTSFSEGTSMTLLEAMALGRPVVATAVSGNVEIVEDGVTGMLVASDDDAALADAIVRLSADADLADRLGARAKARFAERFSIERMLRSYRRIYDELARARTT